MAGYSVTFSVVDNATKQIDQINRRIAQMHAPIERMGRSVNRFLDVSGLRKVGQGFESIGRAAGSVLRSLTAMVPVLGAITSATTIAGMTKLVGSFADWGNQLQTNADQIGISTDELQQWQDATQRAGGTAQEATDALKNLHQVMGDAATGRNQEALAMFRRFGVDITDVNGNLRKTTDVMRDVFKVLDGLPSSYDRSKVAGTLLNDSQAKLYETYKQSGKPLDDFLKLEEQHQRATQDQLKSLNDYRLAMAGLGTTFDQLGRQISATLADDIAPLIKQLDEWVQKHQPDIIKAVKDVTEGFKGWLADVDWDQVKEDVNGIIKLLRIMLQVAEAIGKAVEKTMFLFGLTNRQFTKEDVMKNSPFYAQLTDEQKKQVRQQLGISDEQNEAITHPKYNVEPFSYMNPGSWRNRAPEGVDPYTGKKFSEPGAFPPGGPGGKATPAAPGATGSLSSAVGISEDQYKAFASSISGIESGGKYDIMGGSSGRFAGRYQMGRAEIEETASQLGEQAPTQEQFLHDPKMQERYFERYTLAHHQWLMAHNAKYAAMSPEDKAAALAYAHNQGAGGASTWIDTGMVGKDAFGTAGTRYSQAVHAAFKQAPAAAPAELAQAAPAAPPATAAPTNGTVNVDITHRNAPPDATVTARGSGSVNVAPPRIEHPQLDFASA